MIDAVAGVPFEALALGAPAGLVGTITVEVYDPSDGATIVGPTTAGITEPRAGTYRTVLTVATAGSYAVRWTTPSGPADEELLVAATVVPTVVTDIRPTVAEVAILERTRTVGPSSGGLGGDTGGADVTTFTTTTRPTAAEVEAIIDQAVQGITAQLPADIPDLYYAQTRHNAALYAAILIEGSFFRESLDEGSVDLYRDLLRTGMTQLREDIEGTTEGGVGGGMASVVVRSPTMTAISAMYPDWPVVP